MNRREAALLASGCTAILAGLGLPALAPVWWIGRSLLGLSDHVADPRTVALTFDDGPHPEGTPRVLDFLSERGLRATFFLVGEQVVRRPGLASEIASRGHEIGLHGYEHRTLSRLTGRELSEDLKRAVHVISSATGKVPDLYRPPRGVFTYRGLQMIHRLGWHPVLWAADGRDWRGSATADSISRRVTEGLRGGEVILLHDSDHYGSPCSWRNTVAALPLIVGALEIKGLGATCVTSSSMLLGRSIDARFGEQALLLSRADSRA